ncbi:MAG: heat-shock protein Hsp20 [Rhizobacter sp.]|nr:heat-shock protein Hsp20 [Rhizobacter sp.]
MFYVNVPRRSLNTRALASFLTDPLFDSALVNSRRAQAAAAQPVAAQPALDVAESLEAYTATIDLPGIARDEVKVSIDGRKVTVVAETKLQTQASAPADASAQPAAEGDAAQAANAQPSAPAVAEADAIRVVWRERATRKFSRTFTLPVAIDEAASSAKLDNGVLTLTLSKKAVPVAAQLTVQ